MFTLHIDLHLHFDPPMSDSSRAIILNHQVELPFVPSNDQAIFVPAIDRCNAPMGFHLKDVVFDVSRGVFLASTYVSDSGLPLPLIADELAEWIHLGWRFGSYRDSYLAEDDEDLDTAEADEGPDPWEVAEAQHHMSWRARGREVNRVLKAMIRHLVETQSNEAEAFAFDTTGRYFTAYELEDKGAKDCHREKFRAAQAAFQKMPEPERDKWRDRTRRYPSLERVTLRKVKEYRQTDGGPKTGFMAVR